MSPVSMKIENGIATVTIDHPPVNALSGKVRNELHQLMEKIGKDSSIRAGLMTTTGRTFVAGADISEMDNRPEVPELYDTFDLIEGSVFPWVAVIHGYALGGGLELAMACHKRIAAPGTMLGLPEVNIGLLPGAAGTVRLPRLVPFKDAVDMVTTGKPVNAKKALELGLIDAIAEKDLMAEALALAEKAAAAGEPRRLMDLPVRETPDAETLAAAEAEVRKSARGQDAPMENFDCIRDAVTLPAREALANEQVRIHKLLDSEQAKALRYMFMSERHTARPEGMEKHPPAELNRVGVVGGGLMGAGIATALMLAGISVTLVERDADAANAARERVASTLGASLKRGLISQAGYDRAMADFVTSSDYAAFSDADAVIEAVFENMDVKRDVFRQLDAVTKPDAVLASNTSYLDVNQIAEVVKDPSRVIGLHFFSPAHVMKLLEIVRTDTSSLKTLSTSFSLAKKLKKTPVVAGVCDGFIGNRTMSAYRRDADFMLEEGVLPQEVDAAMKKFGFPMGIYEMQDMAGLDINWGRRKREAPTRDPSIRYSSIADRICELGRYGQKTGAGWYSYEDGARKGTPDPIVEKIILEESARHGFTRKPMTSDEIMARILGNMQSEGQKILDEGIALQPSDIDVVMVLGYGFPRYRGGPMYLADKR